MKQRSIPYWLPALWVLLFHLLRLHAVGFITPDGATYLRYDLLVHTQRLPLYPLLIHSLSFLGLEAELAAKLLATLGATIACVLLPLAAMEMGLEKRHAWLAALIPAVDPLFALHTLQPLTEGVFALWAAATTYALLRFRRTNATIDLFFLIFCGGLAALTRAEGLLFLPLIFWATVRFFRHGGKGRDFSLALLGLAPWLLLAAWHLLIVQRSGYLGEFEQSVAAMSPVAVLVRLLRHLYGLSNHLLIVGLLPAIAGVALLYRQRKLFLYGRVDWWLLMYLLGATWIGISIHWYYDLRFATPLMLWLSLPSAFGFWYWLRRDQLRRRLMQAVILAMVLAGVVLASSLLHEFGKLEDPYAPAAQAARAYPPTLPILSDELAMTSYHLGRKALPYSGRIPFRRSLLILHTKQSDPAMERFRLEPNYTIEEIKRIDNETGKSAAVIWRVERRPETPPFSF